MWRGTSHEEEVARECTFSHLQPLAHALSGSTSQEQSWGHESGMDGEWAFHPTCLQNLLGPEHDGCVEANEAGTSVNAAHVKTTVLKA